MMKQSSLAGLFLVLVLVACGSPAINPPPTPTRLVVAPTAEATTVPTPIATATLSAQPAGQPADARAAIAAAIEALDKNGPYRMTIIASSNSGEPVILDVVPPDRSWYKGSLDGTPVEVIDIGDTAYVLNPDGTWETSTTTDPSADTSLIDPASLDTLTNVEILPQQTINGVLTKVYTFVDSTSPDVTATLWVSQDKGLPVQMQMASSDETVLYVIEYDVSIKVEPPLK